MQKNSIRVAIDPTLYAEYQAANRLLEQASSQQLECTIRSLLSRVKAELDYSTLIESFRYQLNQAEGSNEATIVQAFITDCETRIQTTIEGMTKLLIQALTNKTDAHPLKEDMIQTLTALYQAHFNFLKKRARELLALEKSDEGFLYLQYENNSEAPISCTVDILLCELNKYLKACISNIEHVKESYYLAENHLMAHIQLQCINAYKQQRKLESPGILFIKNAFSANRPLYEARYGWPIEFTGIDHVTEESDVTIMTISNEVDYPDDALRSKYLCQLHTPFRKDIIQALKDKIKQEGMTEENTKIAECFTIPLDDLMVASPTEV